MKKLLFTAILLSSMSAYSQDAPTVTPEGLNNPTPPPTIVVDPNNSNTNSEVEVSKVVQSGDIVNGAPDTHLGENPTVVDPTAVTPSGDIVNGSPAGKPVQDVKNPNPQENPVNDNVGPVEATPTAVE
jgi:hypothetical protein